MQSSYVGRSGEAPQVPYIPLEDRKSPAEYRVLDYDCGRFGPEVSYVDRGIPADYGTELGIGVSLSGQD